MREFSAEWRKEEDETIRWKRLLFYLLPEIK